MKHKLPIRRLNKIWVDETGKSTCGVSLTEKCVVALRSGGWSVPQTKAEKYQAVREMFGGHEQKPKSKKSKPDGFYSSWEWKRARYEALKIHGQRCQCCGWQPGDTNHGHLVVDHIKPRSKFPASALDVGNLQVLCNDCNMGKSNIHVDDFRGVDNWLKNI